MTTALRTETIFDLNYLNKDNVHSNMSAIINLTKSKGEFKSERFKEQFFQALHTLQYAVIPNTDGEIIIQYRNKELCEHLVSMGMLLPEEVEGEKHLFNEVEQEAITANIHKALGLLQVLHPGLKHLIETLIGTIICFKVKGFGGGSASGALGLIWLSPKKKWTVIDYADAIYHEFIHNSIFLDDMIHGILPAQEVCEEEEALTTSAILKKKRPLDRAYHSAGVAIGLMHYYHLLNDEKKALSFLEDLKTTIADLRTKESFIKPYGLEELTQMEKFTETLDYELITRSLA